MELISAGLPYVHFVIKYFLEILLKVTGPVNAKKIVLRQNILFKLFELLVDATNFAQKKNLPSIAFTGIFCIIYLIAPRLV